MKLYDLKRRSYFKLNNHDEGETFFFDHIDGMYSFCTDKDNNVVHFRAWEEVTEVPAPYDSVQTVS